MFAQQQRLDVALRMFKGAAYALHPCASYEIITNIEARDTGTMLQNALHGNRHPLIPQHTLGQIHILDIFRSLVDVRSEAETSISPQVPADKDSGLESARARAHARTHERTRKREPADKDLGGRSDEEARQIDERGIERHDLVQD
jgi:hypothetical protein